MLRGSRWQMLDLVIGDREIEHWELTIAMLHDAGAKVLFHATDVTMAKAVKELRY
jgi:hypothetical protein